MSIWNEDSGYYCLLIAIFCDVDVVQINCQYPLYLLIHFKSFLDPLRSGCDGGEADLQVWAGASGQQEDLWKKIKGGRCGRDGKGTSRWTVKNTKIYSYSPFLARQ